MKKHTLAVIGAGHMGSSFIKGLIEEGWPAEQLWVSNPSEEKRTVLLKQYSTVRVTANNREAVAEADVVVFAVKPSVVQSVCKECRDILLNRKSLIVSIAAGVPIKMLQKWLSNEISIVRAMPNIAATVAASATGLYANSEVNDEQRSLAETILRTVGLIVWCREEKHLDIITALAGSGPAYFFYIIEILQNIAAELGLPEESAHLLTLQTAQGAAKLAISTETSIESLRQQVTSPGGTTEAALKILTQGAFRDTLHRAVYAAYEKAQSIAESLADQ